MSRKHPKHKTCDECGEDDRVKAVVLQVGGALKARRHLCKCCRTVAIVAFGGCLNPWRSR